MKYIELYSTILGDLHTSLGPGIRKALKWLDTHPENTPGRVLTRVQNEAAARAYLASNSWSSFRKVLNITVEDPKPTNAEKLEARLLDLLGVVEAIGNTGVRNMAYELDRAGVKAPEVDHD